MIGHSHADHISHLPHFIGLRNSTRGEKSKPLDIYYPADDINIKDYIDFINKRYSSWLSFKINWFPIEVGHRIELDRNHWIESFKLHHTKHSTTLGYRIMEGRTRLKAEYKGLNIPELLRGGAVNKNSLNEAYNAITLAYCLDSYKIDPADIAGANLAILDCSFLKAQDRDGLTHFTLNEAFAVAEEAKVNHVAVAHISSRYSPDEIKFATGALDSDKYTVIHPNRVNYI